ncbi:hypothetical protein LCGC14_3112910, partial [marine sediment metagenome]
QKYILTIEDETMEFDTVNAIKDALTDDDNFQTKIYSALISKYIGPLDDEVPMSEDDSVSDTDFPTFSGEAGSENDSVSD